MCTVYCTVQQRTMVWNLFRNVYCFPKYFWICITPFLVSTAQNSLEYYEKEWGAANVFYLSWELSWCRVSFLKGDLQFSKFLKNTICIGLCKLKCTEKRFIPFPPLHFLPEFVPHTEFKGRPEDTKWNVLYHTALRNYAAISLQVPSILSILLASVSSPTGRWETSCTVRYKQCAVQKVIFLKIMCHFSASSPGTNSVPYKRPYFRLIL